MNMYFVDFRQCYASFVLFTATKTKFVPFVNTHMHMAIGIISSVKPSFAFADKLEKIQIF